ncbi:sugar phosphate isomerase/epimerase [Tsukamurella sp. 8F]|uniref:sugar phosphate isomerase/epimerase family protein n=1 Tax=unclassified Tsukamurella TaxID=2633480 RepID=UPI0023B95F1A|nr:MULTISPECIES: sugar phosphate isomerase/epimerase [unclassified Tsukamurella]MDF0531707.1 sugar phosphate isomerase/epimerase [Tsukamurella sp. 8J]MDF0588953.1 sugar phosphate isomerase/epimerase [Tsukamurella sp. 8F]
MSGGPIAVGLSTASVYPEKVESAFRYAAELGYDGVELMVWAESATQDVAEIAGMSMRYDVPVLSVHAPCLLISQRVWGNDPAAKLARAVNAAEDLDADTVVVHPPFRWQRRYADQFTDLVASLEDDTEVAVAVENMFPIRLDGFFGRFETSAERLRRRGGDPGPALSAFSPSIDPTDVGFAHYTLDLSHTATAGMDALALMDRMGDGLCHLHLTDGLGASVDEHLLPGRGAQPCAEVLRRLSRGFSGHVILEIGTGSAKNSDERRAMLGEALAFARGHLAGG